MKATEQYFPVVLFIILCKVVLTFESVDEIQNAYRYVRVYAFYNISSFLHFELLCYVE